MIGGKVLDTSAIIQFASRRSVYAHAVVWSAVDGDAVLAVPTVALARAWASIEPDHHAALDVLVGLPVVVLDCLDRSAREVGLFLAGTGTADVVVGAVAWCALRRGWPVVTAEPAPLHTVDRAVQIERLP